MRFPWQRIDRRRKPQVAPDGARPLFSFAVARHGRDAVDVMKPRVSALCRTVA
jgi:hypothetical protein